MKKFYMNLSDLSDYEREAGKVSYSRLCERAFNGMVLCNKIAEIDDSVYYNTITGDCSGDIFQWYIVDGVNDEDDFKRYYGDELILTYSNLLDCYVLAVDHYGTSWDYVLTSIEYTDNLQEALQG